ncbi:MAG: hemolysin family protein [Pseudomonadota bacterium]
MSLFDRARRLIRRRNGDTGTLRESLEGALGSEDTGADRLSLKERTMLRNILGLRDLRVDDVMIPRADIVAVEVETPLGEILGVFQQAGHSRLPVYRETLDDPTGLLHIKDVMGYILKAANGRSRRKTPIPAEALDLSKANLTKKIAQTKLLRDVLFVPPSMPALDLLAKMQTTRIHMGVVIDEYGGTDGLVSIEDLVEVIVGDIEDEHDEEEGPMIEPRGTNAFVADARAPLEDVAQMLGKGFIIGEEVAEDVDTLGGLIFVHAGHIPVRGELIAYPGGYEFEVIEADPRRIKRILIRKGSAASTSPKATGSRRATKPAIKPSGLVEDGTEKSAEAAANPKPTDPPAPDTPAKGSDTGRADAA